MSAPAELLLVAAAVVAVGFLAGLAARLLVARVTGAPRLGLAASTLCGILGGVIAGAATAVGFGQPAREIPLRVILGGLAGTILLLAAAEWIARRRAPAPPGPAQLIAGGESGTVEFKSTARYNRHTQARDPRLELVIATAVAGFFNAHGGTLLIGVADDGTVLGLDDDYQLLRQPDADRYQLWLRDLLSTTLGAPAAAQVDIGFHRIAGHEICLLRVPAARRPVFLRAPKQAGTQFVARIGNSTRELSGQEMLHYAVARWPARSLAGPAHRRLPGTRRTPRPRRVEPTRP